MHDAPPAHPIFRRRPGPLVLCILDGVGFGKGGPDDAVATARTPNLTRFLATCPWMPLRAHGTAVGLPSDDDVGNSEVGHNAMGAGRVFDQGAKLVNQALLPSGDGRAWRTDTWGQLCRGRTLHLLGLVSNGNVHSHIDHVIALVERAAQDGVTRLRIHALVDGRDVAPKSALTWIEPLEALLARHSREGRDYRVASGGGRMRLTMDRYEADWGMVERGWRCHVRGEGERFPAASDAIRTLYASHPDLDDQQLPPFVVADAKGPVGLIQSGDSVLFFNFRGDRAIEISRAFEDETFTAFDRGPRPEVFFAGMMQYDGDLHLPKNFLVQPPTIDRTVGEYLTASGLRTFACAETQKFGHVTYFFNGNRSGVLDPRTETYVQVPSDTRAFEERPWMRCAEVADAVVDAIGSGQYEHVRLNFANGDMVGHTGRLEATRLAVEAVDLQLGRLEKAIRQRDGVLLVTADHGNADEMWIHEKGRVARDSAGSPKPKTAHTVNRVPFIVIDPRQELQVNRSLSEAGLASIGTTVLELCGLQAPADYAPGLMRQG